MSENHSRISAECYQSQESVQQDGFSRTQANLEAQEYSKLKDLLPHLYKRTDLTKAEIVDKAAEHIEELNRRMWSTYSSPSDAAKAKKFLIQRVSREFKGCRQNSGREKQPSSTLKRSAAATTSVDYPEDESMSREVMNCDQQKCESNSEEVDDAGSRQPPD